MFLNKYSAADVHSIYGVSLLPISEATENCVSTEYWDNELIQTGIVSTTTKISCLLW